MFNNIKIATSPLSKEQKKLLKQLIKKNFSLGISVVTYYRNKIKNNTHDSIKIIKKKIIRNLILGKRIKTIGYDIEIYQYGNLTINYIPSSNLITEIHNVKGIKNKYCFDNSKEQLNKKKWLEKFLKINDYKN